MALAAVLALSVVSGASASSFRKWAVGWSAKTARDNARVVDRCHALFGDDDLRFGVCYVQRGRVNLRAERVVWKRQVAAIARGQLPACRGAIRSYVAAAELRQMANLMYLDSHRRTPLSAIASDVMAAPYSTLRSLSDEARTRAVAICG